MPDGTNPQGKDVLQLLKEFVGRIGQQGLEQNPLVQLIRGTQKAGTAAGVASTFVPGKAGETGRVTQEIKNQLNPMQENVLKAVQKVHTKNVEEAMAQGTSGEQVLSKAGISFGDNQPTPEVSETGETQTDPVSLALTGQQPPELGEQTPKDSNLLNRLLISVGAGLAAAGGKEGIATGILGLVGEREKAGIELQKDIRKEAIKADKEGNLKPLDLFSGYTKASADFVKVRDSYGRLVASSQDPSPAGDLALIFNFMKILDPGSVVRESEFQNAATAQKWVEAHGISFSKIGRIWRGERLSSEARKDFTNRGGRLFDKMQKQQKQTLSEFSRLAIKNNQDPSKLFPDIGMVAEQTQPGTKATTGQTSTGNKFRRIQ